MYYELSWFGKRWRHLCHPIQYFKAKIFISKIWFPKKFNIVCFKAQIPYWKLLFKYKYHSSYKEATIGEYKKYRKRHFGKELNLRRKG